MATLVAGAPRAQAQYPSEVVPYTISLGGGWVRPTGPIADRIATGYHVDLGFGIEPHTIPLGVRFECDIRRVCRARQLYIDGAIGDGGERRVVGGQADLVVGHPSGKGVRPYAMGGIGIYTRTVRIQRDTASGTLINDPILGFVNVRPATRASGISDTELAAGWNAGGGVAFGAYPLNFFIEVRYHDISTTVHHTQIIPVTLGFRF